MAKSRCVMVFHHHREAKESGKKVLPFAAEKLRPLLEQAVAEGNRVHIIHERIHTSGHESLVHSFETAIKDSKFMRSFKDMDRKVRERAKADFEKADLGIATEEISRNGSPEERLILEFNQRHSNTAINHMNFYSIDALIETWRAMVHIQRAKRAGTVGDTERVINERIKANYAFRDAFILRDKALIKQIADLIRSNPEEIVFTARGIGHIYMVKLFDGKGIELLLHIADHVPSFGEHALGLLFRSDLSTEEHEKLILLDMLFNNILKGMGDGHNLENRRIAREEAIKRYQKLARS